jgi:4Fe-4S binding domain
MTTALTHPDGTIAAPVKKKLIRRSDRDYSQRLRLASQLSFLVLNVWIGVQFFFWVRFYESGGSATATSRPAGVEGWLPIAGLMNLKYQLATGSIPAIHPASLVLLASFLAISLLLRKAFCSWLCAQLEQCPNTCGSLAGESSNGASICRVGQILACAR